MNPFSLSPCLTKVPVPSAESSSFQGISQTQQRDPDTEPDVPAPRALPLSAGLPGCWEPNGACLGLAGIHSKSAPNPVPTPSPA